MKKFLLSFFLIAAFGIYALQQRLSGSPSFGNLNQNKTNANNLPTANITYKDGEYTGNPADAYYGSVQVKAVVQNGKLTDVQFLSYPQDRNTSIRINNQAMAALKSEAIAAQSAKVSVVSGATDTSQAFQQSLASALNQAA